MTPKTRGHIRKGWDIGKVPIVIGAFLVCAQQLVSINGELIKQQESKNVMASTVAAQSVTIGRLAGEVKVLKGKVSRLERPSRTDRAASLHGTTAADSVAARSPGYRAVVGLVTAPVVLLGSFWRAITRGS